MAATAEVPPFNLEKSRYDQHTFLGRFKQLADQCDPRTLLPETFFGLSLDESVSLLDKHKKEGSVAGVSDEKLWTAKKIVQASVHPDTGEVLLPPFRMAGFAVFNTPVVVGLLIPNQSLRATVLWHSANQTHNAAINYANRNASQPTPVSKLLEGYAGALISSVSLAVGLQEAVKRSSLSAATKATASRFIAFPAVASAAVCNITLMRRNELTTGIEVKAEDGTPLGVSQAAAKKALTETAMTRVVLPIPLLLGPPLLMMALEKTPIFKSMPKARLPVQAAICTAAFVVGLPFAIALFPQEGSMPVTELEPRFAGAVDASGRKVETVVYNKGL
eukprot:comp17160_c0_seq1/m.15995 comp17160_c0_seq1/g.15995  ORF comp17160_c0_seq1/g.15995 comp17160_c0_seq1/m.15995 type:complete len:333 (-) comp17160_c0_seq1:94-1092(-)